MAEHSKRRHRLGSDDTPHWRMVKQLVRSCLDNQAAGKQVAADRGLLYGKLRDLYATWSQELPEVDVFEMDLGAEGVHAVSWVSGGESTSISATRLLELGVTPEVIRQATTARPREGHLDIRPVPHG